MRNPWLAKNPFLSMWLSASGSVLGSAYGHALNAARSQQRQWINEGARALTAYWTAAAPITRATKRSTRGRLVKSRRS